MSDIICPGCNRSIEGGAVRKVGSDLYHAACGEQAEIQNHRGVLKRRFPHLPSNLIDSMVKYNMWPDSRTNRKMLSEHVASPYFVTNQTNDDELQVFSYETADEVKKHILETLDEDNGGGWAITNIYKGTERIGYTRQVIIGLTE